MGLIPIFFKRYPKITILISIFLILIAGTITHIFYRNLRDSFIVKSRNEIANKPPYEQTNNDNKEQIIASKAVDSKNRHEENISTNHIDRDAEINHPTKPSFVNKPTKPMNIQEENSTKPGQHVMGKVYFFIHTGETNETKKNLSFTSRNANDSENIEDEKEKVIRVYILTKE